MQSHYPARFTREMGCVEADLERWLPGAVGSTLFIVAGWAYLILQGSIATIWPMFGVANQLLATTALAVGTTVILKEAKNKRHALVTFLPLCFVGTTTLTAGIKAIGTLYLPMIDRPETAAIGRVNLAVTSTLIVCVVLVIAGSIRKWVGMLARTAAPAPTA